MAQKDAFSYLLDLLILGLQLERRIKGCHRCKKKSFVVEFDFMFVPPVLAKCSGVLV